MKCYDAHQMAAVLIRCAGCFREYYVTKPQEPIHVCLRCRRNGAK